MYRYEMTTDARGYTSRNPLFMRYTPNDRGEFAGQQAYGYLSFQHWVDACRARNDDPKSPLSAQLASIERTAACTAILEAGRRSLDGGGCVVQVQRVSEDAGGGYELLVREFK